MQLTDRIEILCIGDELLDGRTRDRNAHLLGRFLLTWGLTLHRTTMVPDDLESMRQTLAEAAGRATYLVVSGGLGPTRDDLTREAAALWSGVELLEDTSVLEALQQRYRERGIPFAQTNRRQAQFPEGSTILPNEVGTAAGFRITTGHCTSDFVPGVPHEFEWFVNHHIRLLLEPQGNRSVLQKTWAFFGLTESQLADLIEDLHRPELSMHYIPRFPEIRVLVRGRGSEAARALVELDEEITARIGSFLIAVDDQTLAQRLGQRLLERRWTLATAESCTGGLIAQMITSVSGASAYYQEGFVTYSNRAKIERLGVKAETLDRFGAVSPQTAAEMASGARQRAAADVAVSVTGIAGPTGGTPSKPVGTVHLGMAVRDDLMVRELSLKGLDRNQVQTLAAWAALSTLLWYLEDRLPERIIRRF